MNERIGSRQYQILELLLKNRVGLSINEIAGSLNISRNAVQQHFVSLESNGYMQKGEFKKTGGRPVRLFILTEQGVNCFPKQYAWFSELILADLKQQMGTDAFRRYLQKLGSSLSQTLLPRFEGKTQDQRMHELIEVMGGLGYQATAKKTAGNKGYVIEACNCIYHDLAQKYDEICELDKTLISTLLDKDVELVECMAKTGHVCRFKINQRGQHQ
jgi:predicted ArsR family transcriptional regulator